MIPCSSDLWIPCYALTLWPLDSSPLRSTCSERCVDITSTYASTCDWMHPLLWSTHQYVEPIFWSTLWSVQAPKGGGHTICPHNCNTRPQYWGWTNRWSTLDKVFVHLDLKHFIHKDAGRNVCPPRFVQTLWPLSDWTYCLSTHVDIPFVLHFWGGIVCPPKLDLGGKVIQTKVDIQLVQQCGIKVKFGENGGKIQWT